MTRLSCPRCGTGNTGRAPTCELCGAALGSGAGGAARPEPSGGRRDFYTEQSANRIRSRVLMAFFMALVAAVAWTIGESTGMGSGGIVLGLAFGSIGALSAYYVGDRVVLAASGAVQSSPEREPVLYNVVEELCL